MDARQRYFALMANVIYENNYLYLLHQKYHRKYQAIECLMAILSGSSLAAWLIYTQLAIFYATVIVLTQIFNSILPYFEIAKKEETLKLATVEFQPVQRQAEIGWRRIDSENLSEKDIESMMQLLEMSEANVLDKMMSLGTEDDAKICKAASERADKYIEAYIPKEN